LNHLTEDRAQRVEVLLKNLPTEDVSHVDQRKIPFFLRIDKDVEGLREKLDDYHHAFMEFDIATLDSEVKK
jgi:hypothetical protein